MPNIKKLIASLEDTFERRLYRGAIVGKFPVLCSGKLDYVLIDEEDRDLLLSVHHNWYAEVGSYAYARVNKTKVYAHRVIMQTINGEAVDHIDGDKQDNRKQNLRNTSNSANLQNKLYNKVGDSGFRGVSWHVGSAKWRARLVNSGLCIHQSLHHDSVDAARTYDKAALEHYGSDACTNEKLGLYKTNFTVLSTTPDVATCNKGPVVG